ncbi:MAG: UPF0147 family protein [Candidatus Diapherotrites archaeon]|nr:UPF0147 family protein [Candidatus Diapherotrites archaeon]
MEGKADASHVLELMENVLADTTVPRNIRRAVDEAKAKLQKSLDSTNLGSAMYVLDDISNDINMPPHTRTEIWTLISEMETLKEKVK